MSNVSIASIGLPRRRTSRVAEGLAKKAVFKIFGQLKVGSLTLHEGQKSYHFGHADVPGEPQAEVHIHNMATYARVLSAGSIGAGEEYIKAHWSSPKPVEVVRLFSANMAALDNLEAKQSWITRLALAVSHQLNRNSRAGSRENIAAHYDLGNEFFELFLDPTMMYSSALFSDTAMTLEAASEAKLDEVCRQLELSPDDHLLEIGTGWGGMAIHAAKHYGCRVTTTTISAQQYEYASARVKQEGLEDRISLLCEDYRNLSGEYDKLVSIEMIEAVGHEFYKRYFETCTRLLKHSGKMVIQAITVADQRYEQARDSVDYIKRYIFPGGCLPSVAVIADHVAGNTDMQIVHLRDITADYAKTLAHWRERFMANVDALGDMGFDEEFVRLWDYYLCYSEGGFRERIISTVQLTLAKPGYRF